MAISDYDETPGNNTAISGINIAEGCAPGNINNAIRQMMADVAPLDPGGKADQVMTESDLLGTVTQGSGTPNGAIFEEGNNANGNYIKFASGTMICTLSRSESYDVTTAVGALYRSTGTHAWTFPADFTSAPVMSYDVESTSAWVTQSGAPTATGNGSGAVIWSPNSFSDTRSIHYLAIGRWF